MGPMTISRSGLIGEAGVGAIQAQLQLWAGFGALLRFWDMLTRCEARSHLDRSA